MYLYGAVGVLGATAGAFTAYVLSHPKLRKDMQKAPSATGAMRVFQRHMKIHAHELADDVKDFARHNPVAQRMKQAGHDIESRAKHSGEMLRQDLKKAGQ